LSDLLYVPVQTVELCLTNMALGLRNVITAYFERRFKPPLKLSLHNNNSNNVDNLYGAVIMEMLLRQFTPDHLMNIDFAKGPPTLRLSHPTWAASPPESGGYTHRH